MTDLVRVGPHQASIREMTVFLWMRLADEAPPAVYEPQTREQRLADEPRVETQESRDLYEAWAQGPITDLVDQDQVRTFLIGLDRLVHVLIDMDGTDRWTQDDIQYEFYEAAKATFGEDKGSIRTFFKYLYVLLTETPNGSRWGQFIHLLTLPRFIDKLGERFNERVNHGIS